MLDRLLRRRWPELLLLLVGLLCLSLILLGGSTGGMAREADGSSGAD